MPVKNVTPRTKARHTQKANARAAGRSRKQRLRLIRRLEAQGLTSTQIGDRLGLSASTVRDIRADPNRGRVKRRQAKLRRAKRAERRRVEHAIPEHLASDKATRRRNAIAFRYAYRKGTGEWPKQKSQPSSR